VVGIKSGTERKLRNAVVVVVGVLVLPNRARYGERRNVILLNSRKFFLDETRNANLRARQLYKNITMLFLFPVKDGKLRCTDLSQIEQKFINTLNKKPPNSACFRTNETERPGCTSYTRFSYIVR